MGFERKYSLKIDPAGSAMVSMSLAGGGAFHAAP